MAESRRVVKKIIAAHGHHGGAWKVAYADFVTAMMALFMVMWLLASTDQKSRAEISNYFRTGIIPDGDMSPNHASQLKPAIIEAAGTPPPPGEESFDTKAEAAEKVAAALAEIAKRDPEVAKMMHEVHISVTPEGVLIEAVDNAEALLFDVASAELKQPLEHFIEAIAPTVAAIGKPVEINGHTDARPYVPGSRMSNWDLSYQRASAARTLLTSHGVDDALITGVFARGSSHLYVADQPYAAQNRRLSFLIRIANDGHKVASTDH